MVTTVERIATCLDVRSFADNYNKYVLNEMRNALGPDDDCFDDEEAEPMINLQDYAGEIKNCVGHADVSDANWKWSVKTVGKTISHIRWGYLDYIGEKTFQITSESDETLGNMLVARLPGGEMIDFAVIGGRFKDEATSEAGIARIVSSIVSYAHSRY